MCLYSSPLTTTETAVEKFFTLYVNFCRFKYLVVTTKDNFQWNTIKSGMLNEVINIINDIGEGLQQRITLGTHQQQ